ncbi:MAG: vitamin K epoxide reductase family protein [Anaerolineales bacterium]|nr:vitamin K epoxide reductase family protein [Anaerolineales bacterium]MCW5839513.1 vitamin K epoxide reductase family protein [Anaerolineales bacterium]MCW5886869.1 vitamin K epoxide reductase family protein [Anaerolineales bacterium]
MLRTVLIGLAILGLLDAAYLTYIKVLEDGVCAISGGCAIVNTSPYASLAGIPIAAIGAVAYLAMLAVLWLEERNDFFAVNGSMIVFGMALIGVLYSAYLTYLELYVIHAICPFCVVSAVILVAMLVVSILRLRNDLHTA